MDKTAIVILNWNGVKMLTRFLPNVLDYSRDEAVVYVADNASTDNSIDVLKTISPKCALSSSSVISVSPKATTARSTR